MNQELLTELALQTGGSHYPSVFKTYQNENKASATGNLDGKSIRPKLRKRKPGHPDIYQQIQRILL